tara:strand:+ start:384 stop:1088 length:705 start_codon:yes stop_codon:yes gene_type:complete
MSYETDRTWLYKLEGRYIHLWQYVQTSGMDTLRNYKINLPAEQYGNQLIYPNEDITNGLRVEYTALIEPFVDEAWESLTSTISGTTLAFVDGGLSSDTITDTGSGFVTAGFAAGDKIRVIGSASNDGDYLLTAAIAGTLTVATGSFTAETASESITIYQIPDEDTTPDETNHVNLNNMLSLAVVDYIKAQLFDLKGDLERKEYYMKEFWKKVGDNESNKRRISLTFPTSPFAVR